MRKAILLMLLAVVSGSAAAEWVGVGHSDTYNAYADPTTIRRSGDRVKMWSLADYKTPQGGARKPYMSIRTQHEYHCTEEQIRILFYSFYSGNMGGGEVISSDADPFKWGPVAPGTIDKILWEFACGKR